jgi:hypothetical protein
VCLAQEAVPPPAAPATPPEPTGAAPGRGGVGGSFGASSFYADGDYSAAASPRLAFAASFRYAISSWLRLQVSPGFTWTGYQNDEPIPFPDLNFPADDTKDEMLSLLLPVSAQLQFTVTRGRWLYHAGAGPGVYRLWVENRRKVLKDPASLELHRNLFWGGTAEIGVERFFRALPSTSVEGTLATHFVFAEDDTKFPSGYNSSLGAVEARVGANYYFSLSRPKKGPENPADRPAPTP